MLAKDDYLKIVNRQGNGFIFSRVIVNSVIWERNPAYFEKIKSEVPNISFEMAKKIPQRAEENIWVDKWGCKWHYPGQYLDGLVIESPLNDWDKFENYNLPDPEDYFDWDSLSENVKRAREQNITAEVSIEHGFLFLKLTYLRGFENFMFDIADNKKELYKLRDRIVEYWIQVVTRIIECGVDKIVFADDLGLQKSLPVKPAKWREFLKPAFGKIFKLCKENNVIVYLHTDGYVVDIIPDLIEAGVDILNVQDFVNGLDAIAHSAKGKVCIDLDIDRTKLTTFGKPEEIETHIYNCIKTLGSREGGLTAVYGAYPPTPPENITQVAVSLNKYCEMWI